ncbi:MAG TPA: hypothetical protein VFU37_14175, partial [Pyrinomonadaceae bacterium]|nr:hypothetical protein [Pyrinomonadaceae bacterium]
DQYIHDNTDDEITHAAFLNAYLTSKGAEPVNLDQFRTLPSSQATGAQSRVISADVLATKVRTDTFCWLLSVSRCRGTSAKRLADWQRANGCHEQFVVATRREGYASAHVFS